MKTKKKGYGLLLAATIIVSLMALSTLIPAASASKNCLVGYKAHCTFTPVSTIICLIVAGILCKIRNKSYILEKAPAKNE